MENSKVFNVLIVLNKWERRSLDKFVQSTYFNHQEEIAVLYKILNDCIEKDIDFPTKENIYKKIHARQPYNDQQFRLYMSHLFKAIEKFLVVEQIQDDVFLQKLKLMKAYNHHNHHKNFHKTYEDAVKLLAEFPYKNAYYYESYYNIEIERYNENRNLSRTTEFDFQLLTSNFDVHFITEKLKHGCILVSHEQVHQIKYDYGMFDVVLKYVEEQNLLETPAIAIYYYIYQILKFADKQENFEKLLELINKYLKIFPKNEARDILIYANDYCIKMKNSGVDAYARKSFDINIIGIESGAFLENGFLSRFNYENIVCVGVNLKEYTWTEEFIEQYKSLIEDKFQESVYSYNKAFLEYERKNYAVAIKLLQKSDYDDLLLNLSAKNILMKIYFELDYIDLLEYLLGSILTLLKRIKLEQAFKNNYINIVNLTKRLIALKTLTESQRKQLKKKTEVAEKLIAETNPCTEKKWLLEQLHLIK